MKKVFFYIYFVLPLIFFHTSLLAQESIFTGLKGNLKKADNLYEKQAYSEAIELYKNLLSKDKSDVSLVLKIANAYYLSNQMSDAVAWYDNYHDNGGEQTKIEMLRYANSLQTTGNYDKSIIWMEKYLSEFPDDSEVSKRLWQLQNVKFLYEDSIYYLVDPLPINTLDDEFAPVIYGDFIVFASNTASVTAINRKDASTDKSFYKWYHSTTIADTNDNLIISDYSKKKIFGKEIKAKYHKGPISFYSGGDTIVFARTGYKHNSSQNHTMQLFFARKDGKQWIEYGSFPYNSFEYSVNHPSISEDGRTLYFVSDMPGGSGGTDIYSSDYIQQGNWTLPKNLGEEINTKFNESHPFVQDNTLFISSDGHPGLGGLDIFSINLNDQHIEPQNLGFPINTQYDDFDIILDKNGVFGYLASNRNNEVTINDDIFKVKINKLSFPLLVKGIIKYKNNNINNSKSEMILLPHANLELIDKSKQVVEYVTKTDAQGKFTLEVPYESQFLLRVMQNALGTAVVSMEIPGNNVNYSNYEIVIVKELFKTL